MILLKRKAYILLVVSICVINCEKKTNIIHPVSDIQNYEELYAAIKKDNDLWQVHSEFNVNRCESLIFYFEGLKKGDEVKKELI